MGRGLSDLVRCRVIQFWTFFVAYFGDICAYRPTREAEATADFVHIIARQQGKNLRYVKLMGDIMWCIVMKHIHTTFSRRSFELYIPFLYALRSLVQKGREWNECWTVCIVK